MWMGGWRLSADVPTQPGKQARKASAFTMRPGHMRRGRESLWGVDGSIRNGGKEEMAESGSRDDCVQHWRVWAFCSCFVCLICVFRFVCLFV